MTELTPRQRQIFEYIKQEVRTRVPPSVRKLSCGSLQAPQAAHLAKLKKKA